MSTPDANPILRDHEDQEVSPLELLFDLVFVLGVSQLTRHLVATPTWRGAAETLVLARGWYVRVVFGTMPIAHLVTIAALAAVCAASFDATGLVACFAVVAVLGGFVAVEQAWGTARPDTGASANPT